MSIPAFTSLCRELDIGRQYTRHLEDNLGFSNPPAASTLRLQVDANKILNDARAIAVPTAKVDQKTRWAFWDSLIDLASSILQTATFIIAPFVPVLGEAMMAYMAYQLLDEAFEGIVEWAQDRTKEAFEHFMGTVESLVQLGAFAVGGTIGATELRKVLPKEVVAFIDRFKPVTMTKGQTRYWEPDLARYEQKDIPGADSKANERALVRSPGCRAPPISHLMLIWKAERRT